MAPRVGAASTVITLRVPRQSSDFNVCHVKAAGTTSCAGRVVRITFRGPDGVVRTHYRRMAYLRNAGRGRVTVEFALNDLAGLWTVEASDVATGVKAIATIHVK